MCQTELASKLLRTGASVTSVLDTIERRGLVLRERQGHDLHRLLTEASIGRRTGLDRLRDGERLSVWIQAAEAR